MIRACLFLIVPVIALWSCAESPLFSEYHKVDPNGWHWEQEYQTELYVEDTLQLYDMVLELVHSDDFEYQNLYLQIETTFPSNRSVISQVSLELAGNNGMWTSHCRSGRCKIQFDLSKGFRFQEQGTHRFILKQHGRKTNLSGIFSLELMLFRHRRSL